MTQFDSVFHYISTSTFNTLRTVRMKCSVELFEHVMELPFSRQDLQRSHVVDCPITFRHLLNTCKNILNVLNLSSIFKYEIYSYFSFSVSECFLRPCETTLCQTEQPPAAWDRLLGEVPHASAPGNSADRISWQPFASTYISTIFHHLLPSSIIFYHILSWSLSFLSSSITFYDILSCSIIFKIMFYHPLSLSSTIIFYPLLSSSIIFNHFLSLSIIFYHHLSSSIIFYHDLYRYSTVFCF